MFPEIQNVVALARLSLKSLDLQTIAQKSESTRYNPRRFPAVIMRKTEPKSTILVFKSGKLIIIGAKTEAEAKISAEKAVKDISRATEKKVKVETFSVTNMVASGDVGMKIDIGTLAAEALAFKDQSFPGVIYRLGGRVKAALIFSSGKIVFTGAKTKEDIIEAYEYLRDKLKYFRSIKN